MTVEPRDPFSMVVDERRRWDPEWYTWLKELTTELNRISGIVDLATTATIVSSLPVASTAGAGARAFVTDATATTFLSVVAGGGTTAVPVVSDGTNWLIG